MGGFFCFLLSYTPTKTERQDTGYRGKRPEEAPLAPRNDDCLIDSTNIPHVANF